MERKTRLRPPCLPCRRRDTVANRPDAKTVMAQLAHWFEDYKQFDPKPAEIKALFSNTLNVTRVRRNYSTKCCGAEGEVVDRIIFGFCTLFSAFAMSTTILPGNMPSESQG
jgi:hypothetical protein